MILVTETSDQTRVCVCVFFPFILDIKFVGRTSRGHTGVFIHLPSAVRALLFLARGIQPFLSLVDREVDILCTNDLIVLLYSALLFFYHFQKSASCTSFPSHTEGRTKNILSLLTYYSRLIRIDYTTTAIPTQVSQGLISASKPGV